MDLTYVGGRALAVYRLPLNEIVFDFYDQTQNRSHGDAQALITRLIRISGAIWSRLAFWSMPNPLMPWRLWCTEHRLSSVDARFANDLRTLSPVIFLKFPFRLPSVDVSLRVRPLAQCVKT